MLCQVKLGEVQRELELYRARWEAEAATADEHARELKAALEAAGRERDEARDTVAQKEAQAAALQQELTVAREQLAAQRHTVQAALARLARTTRRQARRGLQWKQWGHEHAGAGAGADPA